MNALDAIIAVSLVVTTVWLVWGLFCNERTYRQRLRIIRVLAADDLYRDYCKVSYQQHCRALELFRDPIALYGPRVQTALCKANPGRRGH